MIELEDKTLSGLYDLVCKTCDRARQGEIDELEATCIIMDAVYTVKAQEETSSH